MTVAPMTMTGAPVIRDVTAAAYTIPTDRPESDGTFAWTSTTIVVVHLSAGDATGLGFSYASSAAAVLIRETLGREVTGRSAMDLPAAHAALARACRNLGRPGVASCAISAMDVALWDLKAKLLGVGLTTLLGHARDAIVIYGSGGFTSYTVAELQKQLGAWTDAGIHAVKMKVGRDATADVERVRAARQAIGDGAQLFVDANGAYDRKQALSQADRFAERHVTWFEEPVSSDDLDGLRLLRDRAPIGMDIAAGEYGYDATYFHRMLAAGAVDVLQADATRCGGLTGFLQAGALCDAAHVPLSAHTAPSIHVHACCAVPRVRNLEYFHDHVRIEQMLFDGVLQPEGGTLRPDPSRPGLGLEFRSSDAARFASRQ